MNDAMLDLLDRIVDNAVEEYYLESQLIESIDTLTATELRQATYRMHDRIVMSGIPALADASVDKVETYLKRRMKLHSLQKMIQELQTEIDATLDEDDDRLISEAGHLDPFEYDDF